jgi:hypothetical protein
MRTLTRPGVIAGLLIALALPLVNLIVAQLWERQIVTFDPDGPVIGVLQATFLWEAFLGPIGLVVAGRSAGIRSPLGWFNVFAVGIPVLAWLWFIGVASVGGQAGEPF